MSSCLTGVSFREHVCSFGSLGGESFVMSETGVGSGHVSSGFSCLMAVSTLLTLGFYTAAFSVVSGGLTVVTTCKTDCVPICSVPCLDRLVSTCRMFVTVPTCTLLIVVPI